MRYRDPSKEEVIRDKEGQLVRVYYDDELVYHRHHECFNCGWTGEIDLYPDLKLCPTCGNGRSEYGLGRKLWFDGAWADARLDELIEETTATGHFNPRSE